MVPGGFHYGIEILNDGRTKMEFVVLVLMKHLGQTKRDAGRTMLVIHERGGILLPLTSLEEARRVAAAVSQDAAKLNFPLTCRAVSKAE
jgi:ATP-dependent Clp protease adapter protein ClpS